MTTTQLEKTATREVERVVKSEIAPVGTFTVRRALPYRERHSVGPWVFLDHFGPMRVTPGADGVGAHPHEHLASEVVETGSQSCRRQFVTGDRILIREKRSRQFRK